MRINRYKDDFLIEDDTSDGRYNFQELSASISFRRLNPENVIANCFPDSILVLNSEGIILNGFNLNRHSFFFRKEFINSGFNTAFDAALADQIGRCFSEAVNNNKMQFFEFSYPVNFINRIYQAQMFPSPDNKITVLIKEITETRRAEEGFQQSEMRFRSVWENSIDGMRLLDKDGNIVAANKAYSNLTGIRSDEYLGKSYSYVYSDNSLTDYRSSVEDFKKDFARRTMRDFCEFEAGFRSGKKAIIEVSNTFIESSGNDMPEGDVYLLSIFRDITERKKSEEDLRKSEKLAAIGKMAAYLSHEIKTPLASIKMNIDMISRDPELAKVKQKSLSIIQKEVKRLNKLLRNVLQFSKNYELLNVNINAGTLINSIMEFVEVQLNDKRITLLNRIDNVRITGDYPKLQSVILQLIENSIEAIGENGIIEVYADENKEDNKVTIFIKDSGCGIENPEFIFEPFYTTKNMGTGLGLPIAQKIIEQHNAQLELVSSKPGETIFGITFLTN